jgi:hypothetical protein
MQTRNIILGPTELNTIKISIYKEKENVQKKIEGKKCKQIISVNIILGPTEIKYSIV